MLDSSSHLGENIITKFDGSVLMLYVTLGEGNLFEKILGTTIHANRIMPIIPAIHFTHMTQNAFQSNGVEADENVEAFFMGWDISFDGGRTFIPSRMIESITGSRNISLFTDSHHVLKANFWDVEGLVEVHLNFDGAQVHGPLADALRMNNWWCSDISALIGGNIPGVIGGPPQGSEWTTVYPEWMPLWMVYADIFDNFGMYITGYDVEHSTSVPPLVYKDRGL